MLQAFPLMALLALAFAAGPSVAADRVVFNDERTLDPGAGGGLDGLTAYAGTFAWLGSDGTGTHLRVRTDDFQEDATAEPIQEPSEEGGFPIDLGPGRQGPLAVYPRDCRGDCDIFRYDVLNRRERRIAIAARPRRWHAAAAVWNGRLAFSREGRGRDGLFVTRPLRRLSRRLASEVDLRGSQVTWISRNGKNLFTKRFSRRGRGRTCLLARAGDGQELGSLTLERRYVYWAPGTISFGKPVTAGLMRRRLPSRRCRSRGRAETGRTFSSSDRVDSIAVDRGRAFYEDGFSIREMTDPPLSWR